MVRTRPRAAVPEVEARETAGAVPGAAPLLAIVPVVVLGLVLPGGDGEELLAHLAPASATASDGAVGRPTILVLSERISTGKGLKKSAGPSVRRQHSV